MTACPDGTYEKEVTTGELKKTVCQPCNIACATCEGEASDTFGGATQEQICLTCNTTDYLTMILTGSEVACLDNTQDQDRV